MTEEKLVPFAVYPQVHSGFKSQELSTSQSGQGGCNQLVLDDSPGANRIQLSSSSAATRLQLGHLLQQTDNQRLQARGHGLDLATSAWGAVRAGQGLLISAHAKPASTSGGAQMDSREPTSRLEQSVALQIGAVAMTPTPLQRWLSRSYFGQDPSFFDWDGKRDDMFARGDWTSEFTAFHQAIEDGGKPEGAAKPSLGEKAKQVVGL